MFTNYLKTALRNFYRNKSITIIKILGLSLGLAVTFFILIYISTETSYNDYNLNEEKIFRVNQQNHIHGWKTANTPFPMRDDLVQKFPEIQNSTRIIQHMQISVEKENKFISEPHFLSVDGSFFEIFTLHRILGDLSQISEAKYNLIVTKSAALKYFGKLNVVNESLNLKAANKEYVFNIVAVIDDIPETSTIKADFITNIDFGLSMANSIMTWSDGKERDESVYKTNWETNFLETYILFNKNDDHKGFDLKLKNLEAEHLPDTTERDYYIQNLGDIYLHSTDMFSADALGDLNSIYIFSVVAFLVLLIACINYIILSVSEVLNRKKEVGVRKILGANQTDIYLQLLTESVIIVLITLPLSFILIEQFRPLLENIIRKEFIIDYNSKFIVGLLSVIVFVVFIPGLNIVSYLGRITPITVLKKETGTLRNKFGFRKILIVLQFIIFVVLVVITIGIKRQLNYSINGDLGFKPENKIVLQVADIVKSGKYQTLKSELLKNPDVESVSGAMWLPPSNGRMSVSYSDSSLGDEPIKLEALFVDHDFVECFGLELIEGKSLKEFEGSEALKIVANKEAKSLMGGDVIGKGFWGGEIVGVVNDFKFHSFHENKKPTVLIAGEYMIREMVIELKSKINRQVLDKIAVEVKGNYPDLNTDFEILTDRFNLLYKKEQRLGKLIGIFSFIAIFIASIGLLGLTMFNTQKQGKNIAIRKVSGASSFIIWRMLVNAYLKLILLAFLFAIPLSYYLLNKWMQNFAYKTEIAWWIFAAAGMLAVIISLFTISWYSIKAARQNPVGSLRYE